MFDTQDLPVSASVPALQPAQAPAGAAQSVHLLDRLTAVFKHRRLAGTAFTLVVAVMMVQTYSTVPTYEAKTRIEIDDPKTTNLANLQESNPLVFDDQSGEYRKTQLSILQSRGLAKRLVEKLDLANQPAFLGDGRRPHDPLSLMRDARASASAWIRSKVTKPAPIIVPQAVAAPASAGAGREIGLINAFLGGEQIVGEVDTKLVWIIYHHSNPQFTALAADELAREYIIQNQELRQQNFKKLLDFVNGQVTEQGIALERANTAIANYRERNNAMSLDGRSDLVGARLNALNSDVLGKRSARIQKQNVYEQVKGVDPKTDAANSYAVIGTSKQVVDAINALHTATDKRDELLKKHFLPGFPDLQRAETEVGNAQRSLVAARENVIQQLKNDYDAALADEHAAESALSGAKTDQVDLNRLGIGYEELKRQADSILVVYNQLLGQQKTLQVSANSGENNVHFVDHADIPKAPISPNPRKAWMQAVMAGLVVAFGLAFGLEYLDDTVKTPEDITRRLKVPLLGLVPGIRGDRVPILSETVPHDFGEAFRSLRTSLVFTSGAEHTRVIAVTSSQPLEGKTTTAANLALALALGGARVLLIDADMRRPGLHKTLGIANNTGLSHLLTGHARVREAIQRTNEPNLLVITAGRTPPNPSELLASERMSSFIINLQQGPFDWVVIDTPPVLAVTDAVIIAPKVSGVVFVIGSEMTRRVHAERALDTLRGSRPRALTAVLNRVDFDRNKYYYSRYYGYQYKSYYGQSQGAA
jgi:capsular exopolysaccharide synthesis family protein